MTPVTMGPGFADLGPQWVLWWRPSGRARWREVKRGTPEQCSERMHRMVQDFDGVDCGDFYTAAEGRHP